jgi:hypothetical protein
MLFLYAQGASVGTTHACTLRNHRNTSFEYQNTSIVISLIALLLLLFELEDFARFDPRQSHSVAELDPVEMFVSVFKTLLQEFAILKSNLRLEINRWLKVPRESPTGFS